MKKIVIDNGEYERARKMALIEAATCPNCGDKFVYEWGWFAHKYQCISCKTKWEVTDKEIKRVTKEIIGSAKFKSMIRPMG